MSHFRGPLVTQETMTYLIDQVEVLCEDTQKRRAKLRDRGCRNPGCPGHDEMRIRSLHAHHIVHKKDGGGHEIENLITLCPQCHRLAHAGLIEPCSSWAGDFECEELNKPAIPAVSKERLTVHVTPALADRLKDAVYWTPGLTLAALAERGLAAELARLEKEKGKPFPKREGNLPTGRPIKTRQEVDTNFGGLHDHP